MLLGFFILKTKFLIIRFSSIGDIVLTSPVVRCLNNQISGAEIHFLTKKRNADLIEFNPNIHQIHLLGNSLDETIARLKEEKFDYIIDLHHNWRSFRVKTGLHVKSFNFNKLNIHKMLLTIFKINILPACHIVDRNLAALKHFKVIDDGKGLDHFIGPDDEFPREGFSEDFQNGFVAIVLGGTYVTKKLPAYKLKALINSKKYRFVLLGGKNDKATASEILGWNTGNVIDLTGVIRINQSASIIQKARLVITNDTGLMHIAAAYHKKILSVWGNTVPEFGMAPYLPGQGSEILEMKGMTCRPCSKLGYAACPKKHFRCMNELPENRLLEWVDREF